MRKVALHTLGCKLNFAETSTLGRQFADRGFEVVPDDCPADVFLLNTCSVTARADAECRQVIRRVLRRSPSTYVIVTGCYAQLHPAEVGGIDGVDLVLGTNEKFHVFDHEEHFVKRHTPQTLVSCVRDDAPFELADSSRPDGAEGRTRAFLKVQDGCDYHCAFCTIPLARGGSRSSPVGQVVEQAGRLVREGYREIVLTGVNVGDFGSREGTNLLGLLRALERVPGIDRIRVSSIEPNLLSPELLDYMLGAEHVCPHFHLPLQSGNDAVLHLMRRRYGTGAYARLVESIKRREPSACIGADVIVGFPGETEERFAETARFLADLPLSYLHVFTYSEREATAAPSFANPVPPPERFRRNEILRTLGSRKRSEFARSFLGKTVGVLFESKVRGSRISGLTPHYLRVEAEGDSGLVNTIHDVTLGKAEGEVCYGVLCHKN